jgi:diguanylate cyclase (GGDEF)-like protein
MISLKKHMEAHAEELLKAAMGAYRAALAAMAKAGAQAAPQLGDSLQQKLTLLQQSIADSSSSVEMARVQQNVDLELGQWGDKAAQHSIEKEKEIKEIMVAVAAATEALGERNHHYATEFSELTTRLHSIARLDDLSSIRRSVTQSATELKAVVGKMAAEGEQSVMQLRAEVSHYRDKLAQSEKREAVDPLTGLASRREIDAQIDERISWRRPFCLAVLDLNGFKRINDVYGHIAGDDALRQFADELKAQFRPIDVVGRWGGDEFVVIVDSDLEDARARLERVRQWAFGDYTISTGRENIQVDLKASIGIAAWDLKESAVELMARADERMYAEKKVTSMPRRVVA